MTDTKDFTVDMILQYTIVGLILLAAFTWMIWKLLRKKNSGKSTNCCGCAISDTCKKKDLIKENNKVKDHCL